jgi:cytoskeleton protein RodZ
MSAAQSPAGEALRAAREAHGLSVEEAATRLRLMQRQIEAMEAGDFEALGRPVFARGFVRNYARLLGIDPAPLLAGVPDAGEARAPAPPAPPVVGAQPWFAHWRVIAAGGAILLLIVVPVALYLWLDDRPPAASPAPAALPAAAALPAPVAKPAPLAAAAPPAASTPAVTPAPAVAAAPVPEPQARAEDAAPRSRGQIHFDFGGDAWVEVRDATGRMLLRKLNPAGTSIDLSGEPPFDFVVGNAAQVRMTYNGRPLDLRPYIDITVARFSLEE